MEVLSDDTQYLYLPSFDFSFRYFLQNDFHKVKLPFYSFQALYLSEMKTVREDRQQPATTVKPFHHFTEAQLQSFT